MSYRSCYGNPYFDVAGSTLPALYPVGSTIAIPLPLEVATNPLGPGYIAHILDGLTGNLTGQYLLPAGTWLYSATIQVSNVDPTAYVVDTTISVVYDGVQIAVSDDGLNVATCAVPGPINGQTYIQSTTCIMPACPIISDGTGILDVRLGVNPSAGAGWIFSDAGAGVMTQKLVRIA
jgi:hypothetical protein